MNAIASSFQKVQTFMLALAVMAVVAMLAAAPSFAQTNPASDLASGAQTAVSSAQSALVPILAAVLLFGVAVAFIFGHAKKK